MNVEQLKDKIREIFGKQIAFNNEFDYYAKSIHNIDESLVLWCTLIKERKIPPISKSKLGDRIVFIKKIGSSDRCLVIKIKNGDFQEIHLADHVYYNKLTRALGIKKSSETY